MQRFQIPDLENVQHVENFKFVDYTSFLDILGHQQISFPLI